MLVGSILYAISLVLLFTPPKDTFTPFQISLWFGVLYVFFFVADTICNIPYQALGPELSSDSKERESLYLVFYIFQYLGVLFASLGPVFISKIIRVKIYLHRIVIVIIV
jgi:Na+/melibiose symporter-like transporter